MPGPGYSPPDYQYQGPDMTNGHYSDGGGGVFSFKKRFQRIDWRKLAAVDVERISRELDFNSLQENVMNITFCNIESEVDTRLVDSNFLKLFKLAQLTIEYLLHSQDFLASSIRDLEEKLAKVQQEHEETKKMLDKKCKELAEVKKQSHKRKKLLASQQQLISVGPDNYHQCPYCPKSFINHSFLQSHLVRRHADHAALYQSSPQPSVPQPPVQSRHIDKEAQVSPVLERELREIKERLRFTESQLETERSAWREKNVKEQDEFLQQQEQQRLDLEQWKQEQLDQQRQEGDARENMLMTEIRELNEKMAASDRTIHDLQRRVGKTSHLGNLQDDLDLDREELEKQRAEMSVINEQLSSKLKDVESKFAEETRKLKQKMKARDEQHKEEIEKLTEALQSGVSSQGDSGRVLGKTESEEIRRQLDDIQRQATRERQKREQLEKNLQEKEQLMKEMATRPPAVVPRKPPASPTPDQRERSPSPMKKVTSDRPPPVVPREEVTAVKNSSPVETPKEMKAPSGGGGKDDEEEEEDDEVSSEVSVSSLGTTGRDTKNTAELLTGTTTSVGSGTGTMELSLTSKNERVMQVLKKDPRFLEAMKEELSAVLDEALEKRGISPAATGISVPVYQNKMSLLKTERQQKAKKHTDFYDMRQLYINQVDEMARERLRGGKNPGVGGRSAAPSVLPRTQSPPRTTPASKLTPSQHTPKSSATPSWDTPKASYSATPATSARVAGTPAVAQRPHSPSKNPGLSQTFSSTATSSQWESEELSFGESDSAGTDVGVGEKADIPKAQAQTEENDEDGDDWDSEDISSSSQNALKVAPVQTVAKCRQPVSGVCVPKDGTQPACQSLPNSRSHDPSVFISPLLRNTQSKLCSKPPQHKVVITEDMPVLCKKRSSESIVNSCVIPTIQDTVGDYIGDFSDMIFEEDEEMRDIWDYSGVSELDEISPSKTAAGRQARPYSTPKPKGAMVSELTKSIEMQLTGRKLDKKPAGSVDLAPPDSAREGASPATPEIKMLGDGAEDDGSDFSLTSEEGVKPATGTKHNTIESTNTYGTSVWGGSSSKAASSINPVTTQGTAKSSLVSVTDWDSEDSDLDLADL